MTNIDKRFKALAFVWILFCFYAAQHYVEHTSMEGMFMRVFMYGVFASPVWLGYGWIYLNDTMEMPLKLYIAPALGYFIFGLYLNDEYHEGKLTLLAWACGFFYLILVFPYTSAAVLFFKLKWKRILKGSSIKREETPLEDVLALDFLWAKNIRASKGKPTDGIPGSKIIEVMRIVKQRWSNLLPIIELKKRMTNPSIGIKREDIFPLMQIFEEEFGIPQPMRIHSWEEEKEAIQLFEKNKILAEASEPLSQFTLACLYSEGRGVAKNENEEIKWIQKSALHGNSMAQFSLGSGYYEGRGGLPQDKNEAYFWLLLSADNPEVIPALRPTYVAAKEKIGAILTPEQRLAAQERAKNWKPNMT